MLKKKVHECQVMNIDNFLSDTELVVILVGHDEIKNNQEILSNKLVYDTKNIIECGKTIYKL